MKTSTARQLRQAGSTKMKMTNEQLLRLSGKDGTTRNSALLIGCLVETTDAATNVRLLFEEE